MEKQKLPDLSKDLHAARPALNIPANGQLPNLTSIFDYAATEKQQVAECVVCGEVADNWQRLCTVDRYGYAARFSFCLTCATVYLNPRMTPEQYALFYSSGTYRDLIRQMASSDPKDSAKHYAGHIMNVMSKNLPAPRTMLDIGGGLDIWSQLLPETQLTVVDPGVEPGLKATKVIATNAEEWEPTGQYDLGVCLHTIDHLTDPLGVLRKMRSCCKALLLDIIDFPQRWCDWYYKALKIDHPINWNDISIQEAFRRTGWKVTHKHITQKLHDIAYLCFPTEPTETRLAPAHVDKLIREKLWRYNTSPLRAKAPY